MLPIHVALVSNSKHIEAGELSAVSAALQVQSTRDFTPLWGVPATVDAFPSLSDVPIGSWPVIVEDDIHAPGAAGYHWDKNNQPYALVQYSDTWSLTASHETLEMLGDPAGNRTQGGPSPKDGTTQVQFLVEMCDPCEDAQFAYSIDGVLVSDFITPRFYDAASSPAARYSFTGAIPAPREVLSGGYISFLDPSDDHMYQQIWPQGASGPELRDLGPADPGTGSLREWVDSRTAHPQLEQGAPADIEAVSHALARKRASSPVRAARANALQAEIQDLLQVG